MNVVISVAMVMMLGKFKPCEIIIITVCLLDQILPLFLTGSLLVTNKKTAG